MALALTSSSDPSAHRSARLTTTGLALAALMVAIVYAFYFVFSRSMSLDEGYLMITVQGFNGGHALYDSVFTQYGPFYYFYQWLLRSVLGIPLTHDATRLLCITHWVVASGLLGAAAWRMTRSGMTALLVSILSVVHLSAIANEPGHPQELVVVLLALGMWIAAGFPRNTRAPQILAGIAVALAFTKINVGAFFTVALVLALLGYSSHCFSSRPWTAIGLALSGMLPWLLVRQHLSAEWCRHFALIVTVTTVAALWVAQQQRDKNLSTALPRTLFPAAAVFALISALMVIVTLMTGTSWAGLLDGLVLTPMKMPRFALLPINIPGPALLSGMAALATALIITLRPPAHTPTIIAALKVALALSGSLLLLGQAQHQLIYLLPWIWLVILPGPAAANQNNSFARTFLALAVAWQSLQVYPIAGTQVTLATFLLVLAYGVCLADGLRFAASVEWGRQVMARLTPTTRALAHALAGVLLLFLFTNTWCKLPEVRRGYARLIPLELPGSRFIRMDEELATMNQQLARYLEAECDTFVSYPGLNSLYFWSGKTPPTQLNSTGWGQLTHAQQKEILGALQQSRRPKLVITEALMQRWDTPYADPIRPLVRFVTEECRAVNRIGRCLIFEPKAKQLSAKQ